MKRRLRPLTVTIVSVHLLAAAAGGWLWWRFSLPPTDGVVEAFNAYARTVLPAGRASHTAINAMIAAALDRAYPDVPHAQRRDKWDGLRSELRFLQMSPLDHPRALRALEEYARFEPLVRECDGLLRYAAVRTEAPTGSKALFNLPSGRDMIDVSLLVSLQCVAMRLAAEEGDWDEAAARYRTGLALARQLSAVPLIVYWTLGMSTEEMVHGYASGLLVAQAPPAAFLATMLATHDEFGPPPSVKAGARGEALDLPNVIAAMAEMERGSLDLWDSASRQDWLDFPPPRRLLRDARRGYEKIVELADDPIALRAAAKEVDPQGPMDIFVSGGPIDAVSTAMDRVGRHWHSLLVLLALHRVRLETGAFPDDPLAALGDLAIDPLCAAPLLVEEKPCGVLPYTIHGAQRISKFVNPTLTRERQQIEAHLERVRQIRIELGLEPEDK